MTRNRALAQLMRRQRYLERQIERREVVGEPADFAKAEHAAIRYVLAAMGDAEAIGLYRLGLLTLEERESLRRVLADAAVAS